MISKYYAKHRLCLVQSRIHINADSWLFFFVRIVQLGVRFFATFLAQQHAVTLFLRYPQSAMRITIHLLALALPAFTTAFGETPDPKLGLSIQAPGSTTVYDSYNGTDVKYGECKAMTDLGYINYKGAISVSVFKLYTVKLLISVKTNVGTTCIFFNSPKCDMTKVFWGPYGSVDQEMQLGDICHAFKCWG